MSISWVCVCAYIHAKKKKNDNDTINVLLNAMWRGSFSSQWAQDAISEGSGLPAVPYTPSSDIDISLADM